MEGLKRLRQLWNDNPLAVLAVLGAGLAGAGKFVDSISAIQSKRAYAKQVKLKSRKQS